MIGDIKIPCDFPAAGIRPPAERNVLVQPYVALDVPGIFHWEEGPRLSCSLEGEALAQRLVDVFLILRNGSVSERLWRMVLSYSKPVEPQLYDAQWLMQMPIGIWDIVRDQVLRCS
jgi:hypothetical protein